MAKSKKTENATNAPADPAAPAPGRPLPPPEEGGGEMVPGRNYVRLVLQLDEDMVRELEASRLTRQWLSGLLVRAIRHRSPYIVASYVPETFAVNRVAMRSLDGTAARFEAQPPPPSCAVCGSATIRIHEGGRSLFRCPECGSSVNDPAPVRARPPEDVPDARPQPAPESAPGSAPESGAEPRPAEPG